MRTLCLLLLLCVPCLGQTQPMTAKEIEAFIKSQPPGTRFQFDSSTRTETGTATGAGGQATGDKAELKIDGKAPTVQLPSGGNGSGGDSNSSGSASVLGIIKNPLLWMGLACLGVGVWYTYRVNPATGSRGDPKQQTKFFVAGTALVVASLIPAWAWILGGAAFVVYFVLDVQSGHALSTALGTAKRAATRNFEALRAAVDGINDVAKSDPAIGRRVKEAVKGQAEGPDNDVIREAERASL